MAQDTFIDPVCGMEVNPQNAAAHLHHGGQDIYFCAAGCKRAFEADPEKFLKPQEKDSGGHGGQCCH